jgi:hypothetical protein
MPVAFVTADLEALQPEFTEAVQEPTNTVHRILVPPRFDDAGAIAFAKGEDAFVTGAGKIAKGGHCARTDDRRIRDESADVLRANHGISGIVEPLGAVLDPEHAIPEVFAVRLDLGFETCGHKSEGTRNVRQRWARAVMI